MIQRLYDGTQSCVRINDHQTSWFPVVECGVRQGCCLSPTLFNVFINDLISDLNSVNQGIPLSDDNHVNSLLYADDLAILSVNEESLQAFLYSVNHWCLYWGMDIKLDKSGILHCRQNSKPRPTFPFMLGGCSVNYVEQYQYLGIFVSEFLDLPVAARGVAEAGSRALGSLIGRAKAFGGMTFLVFTKLLSDSNVGVWISCLGKHTSFLCEQYLIQSCSLYNGGWSQGSY